MVEKVVYNIINANLVKDPGATGRQDVMDLQELYDHLERHRLEVYTVPLCSFATVHLSHLESDVWIGRFS